MNQLGQISPFSFQIISHKLLQVTDEMALTLANVSGSPVVTEIRDFNVGLFQADGSMVTMGPYITIQVASMPRIIRSLLQIFEISKIREGDMFITNDPLMGTLHQSDISILAPVYDNNELVAWTGVVAHEVDVGGLEHGSMSPHTYDVYQEGIRIPGLKIVEQGVLKTEVFDLLLTNVREPGLVGLDIKARIAANNVAKVSLSKLIQKYGIDIVKSVMQGMIERSEKRLRERLAELPDGILDHTDFIDHDGHKNKIYTVKLSMEKRSDSLVFDFTGTDPQAPGPVNCALSGAWAGVLGALGPLLCFDIPWNEGMMKPIKLIAPELSMINAKPPAPVGMASVSATYAVRNCAYIALSRLLARSEKYCDRAGGLWQGGICNFLSVGENESGTIRSYLGFLYGGAGATRGRDGYDCSGPLSSIRSSLPNIENIETYTPILFLFYRLSKDSGGAGKFRGGSSCEWAFIKHGGKVFLTGFGHGAEMPTSIGVSGGLPGCCIEIAIKRETDCRTKLITGSIPSSLDVLRGKYHVFPSKTPRIQLLDIDVFYMRASGGGGYGDPIDREPERVVSDVSNELVSVEASKNLYGVVFNSRFQVDYDRTKRLRQSIRRKRLAKQVD